MTREQLRLRYVSAVGRHWRSSLDQSGPTPALIDDLVAIAEQHVADTVKAAVLMQAEPPVLVAASDAIPQETVTADSPGRSPTARTRHRPRGGAPT